MNLWTLLVAVSSMGPLGSAVSAAYAVEGSVPSYVVAAISGLLLATANAWAWTRIGHATDNHLRSLSEARQEHFLRTLYIALAIWALCAALLGVLITSAILRLTT